MNLVQDVIGKLLEHSSHTMAYYGIQGIDPLEVHFIYFTQNFQYEYVTITQRRLNSKHAREARIS